MSDTSKRNAIPRRDMMIAAACGVFVAMMVGASYAAVPLYDWFCRTTGFGGRTQVATSAPTGPLGRTITIRFDGNVAPGLPWRVVPEQNSVQVRVGEVFTVNYIAQNLAARETYGNAGYNVAPPTTGIHFQKINCFCFTEQRLGPGEKREMPIIFYVDPAIEKDPEFDDLNTITLSYSFYAIRAPEKPVASSGTGGAPRTN